MSRRNCYTVRWKDPITGQVRQQAAVNRREAMELVNSIEDSLDRKLVADLPWSDFRRRYIDEQLSGCSERSRKKWQTASNWLEELFPTVETVTDVTAPLLSAFAAELRLRGKPETTIGAYLAELRRSLNWAADMGIIAEAPIVKMPKRAKGVSKLARSRPVTNDEFQQILAAIPKVRDKDASRWQRLVRGLWESGFRLGELLQLCWDGSAHLIVDASGEFPVVRIRAQGEKAHRDRIQPITPEFWQLLVEQDPKIGLCFPVGTGGRQMSEKAVGRVIAKFGQVAGVVTGSSGKTATSHDIGRRAFATRYGSRMSPTELKEWMRHASVETTMRYYYEPRIQDLASKVWKGVSGGAPEAGGALGGATGGATQNNGDSPSREEGEPQDIRSDCQ